MMKLILGTAAALLLSTSAYAAPACPSFPKHPNMDKAAKDLCAAHEAMHAAIAANKHELGGHGEKAEAAMAKAMEEIHEAAKVANANKAAGSGSHAAAPKK